MENDMERPSTTKASLLNAIFNALFMLTAIITLSIGLAFYFLVEGTVGYGVGIAMFIVAAIVFLVGEAYFFKNMGTIKHQAN